MMPALLDHVWQSTVFAVGVFLLTLLFRNNGAPVRFWLWFVASVKFLFPFSLLAIAGHHLFALLTPSAFVPVLSAIQPAAKPFSLSAPFLVGTADANISYLHLMVAIWALGTASIVAFWCSRWIPLHSTLLKSRELPLLAPIPVKLVTFPLEPGLFGIWRPVVLLPECVVRGLSGNEIDAILAHELCHLRRRDNLLALVQMFVEALFWFHPLVWWIGARLVEERERACDESVLAGGNNPQAYAETILKVCRLCVPSPLACAAGVSSSDLDARVVAIMADTYIEDIDPAKQMLLALTAAISVAMPLIIGGLESAPVVGRYHGTTMVISMSSALMHMPSATMQDDRANPEAAGKTAQMHQSRRHKPLIARPYKIEIALNDTDISNHLPAPQGLPPKQAPDTSGVVPINPVAADNHVVAMMGDSKPATVDAAGDSDEIVCRPPQQLPASRFLGPKTCRTRALWDQYRRRGLDIAPDGIRVVSANSLESADAFACPLTIGTGGIARRFGLSFSALSC